MVNLSSMEAKFFLTISFKVCTSGKMSFSGEWSRSRTRVSPIVSRCLSRMSTGGLLSFSSLASMPLIRAWFVCNESIGMLVDVRRGWAGNRPEWLDRHCQTQWTVRMTISISVSFLLGLCERVYELYFKNLF